MFYSEKFLSCTEERQPYSIATEPTYKYSEYDGFVKKGVFYIKRPKSKQLLLMPETDEFEMSFSISYMPPAELGPMKNLTWGICVGYDADTRSGYELALDYVNEKNTVDLILYNISGIKRSEIKRTSISNIKLQPYIDYPVKLSVKMNTFTVKAFDNETEFSTEFSKGIVALEKLYGAGSVGFSDIEILAEEVQKKLEWSGTFIIPRTDGGVLDYNLTIAISKYMQEKPLYEISYKLEGGAYENNENYDFDVYLAEYDVFNNLYFSLGSEKYYLYDGKLTFVDKGADYSKHTCWLKLKKGGKDIPFCGIFKTNKINEFKNVFIGYRRRRSMCGGNVSGERMFTYDKCGKLLFIGHELNKNCFFDVKSSEKKEMTKRIPQTLVDYDDTLFQVQNNHYFVKGEAEDFVVDVYSRTDRKYLDFEAETQNVWFEKIGTVKLEETDPGENIFENFGYKKYRFRLSAGANEQGVYHLKISCSCGKKEVFEHISAFEVFDDALSESPQESSHLPMIYNGDGCTTKYAPYDPAFIKPDCNVMHYIGAMHHTPKFVEKRRAWELVSIFRRKLFVWMTKRTMKPEETYKDYPGTTANADYINYIYPGIEDSKSNYYRYDLWKHFNFDVESARKMYNEFLDENEDLKDIFPAFDENDKIDDDKWGQIPGVEFERWIQYTNDKTEPLFKKQWEEIKQINPNAKRYSYGPYHVYGINHSGGYVTKWFGFSDSGLTNTFADGFLQFEDYPFVCGYGTHISAWNMATIKLKQKNLRIAPELYDSFDNDCPDGFVAYAKPPLGGSFAPPYQTVTQLYEYLFNTAVFDGDSFRFWNDNIFMVYEHASYEIETRYRLILKAWKIYLDNKPAVSNGGIAYIADYDCTEDMKAAEIDAYSIYNKSLTAMSVIREVNAEMGYIQGFVTDWKSFEKMPEDRANVYVLPSLKNVKNSIKDKIRRLYKNGAVLIAAGNIDGLEDIFGVETFGEKFKVQEICYNGEFEPVYPYNSEFPYRPTTAEVVVASENAGVILKNGKTLLINASLGEVGTDSWDFVHATRANISKLIRKAIADFMYSEINPEITADEQCGLTSVTTVDGENVIVLTDYSPYRNNDIRRVNVKFNGLTVKKVEYMPYDENDLQINLFESDGKIDEFSVNIRPRETLIFKLK